MLIPSPTYEAFLADPLGHYCIGDQLVAWAASPTLVGYTLWGSLTNAQVDAVIRPSICRAPRPSLPSATS